MTPEPPDQFEIETAMAERVSHGDIAELARAMGKNRSVVSRQFNPGDAFDNPVFAFCLLLYGCKRKKPEVMRLAWEIAEGYYAKLNGREVGEQSADELLNAISDLTAKAVALTGRLPPDQQMIMVSRIYGRVTEAIGGADKTLRRVS